jgi:hypothetical protein
MPPCKCAVPCSCLICWCLQPALNRSYKEKKVKVCSDWRQDTKMTTGADKRTQTPRATRTQRRFVKSLLLLQWSQEQFVGIEVNSSTRLHDLLSVNGQHTWTFLVWTKFPIQFKHLGQAPTTYGRHAVVSWGVGRDFRQLITKVNLNIHSKIMYNFSYCLRSIRCNRTSTCEKAERSINN